jgi:hypothetical protein
MGSGEKRKREKERGSGSWVRTRVGYGAGGDRGMVERSRSSERARERHAIAVVPGDGGEVCSKLSCLRATWWRDNCHYETKEMRFRRNGGGGDGLYVLETHPSYLLQNGQVIVI